MGRGGCGNGGSAIAIAVVLTGGCAGSPPSLPPAATDSAADTSTGSTGAPGSTQTTTASSPTDASGGSSSSGDALSDGSTGSSSGSPDASGSASAGESSTGSSDGTTTGSTSDVYPACPGGNDDECEARSNCVPVTSGGPIVGTFCGLLCDENTQCPAASTGTATPTCIADLDPPACALGCKDGTCPDGMGCIDSSLGAFCFWTQ